MGLCAVCVLRKKSLVSLLYKYKESCTWIGNWNFHLFATDKMYAVQHSSTSICHHRIYIKYILCPCVCVCVLYDKHTHKRSDLRYFNNFFFAYLAMRFRVLFGHGLIFQFKKYLRLLWPNFRLIFIVRRLYRVYAQIN